MDRAPAAEAARGSPSPPNAAARVALLIVVAVYLHNAVPFLTMMPRMNIDEPWLMERAYQVMMTGQPRQPMYGLDHAYMLQVGYPYLLAGWMRVFGVGLMQARALGVALGLGILLFVAAIGKRLVDPIVGIAAALFLAADSNFLGGVRNARTDIPAVFFAAAAFSCYASGRSNASAARLLVSGACAGFAMLCHGNSFWVVIVLGVWAALDIAGRQTSVRPLGFVSAGVVAAAGPYALVVLTHLAQVREQVQTFVPARVPGFAVSSMLRQLSLEIERYKTWYFGLVTNVVPNPLLRAFQLATVVGLIALICGWRRPGKRLLLVLAVLPPLLFGALVANKVPVYMPHLLLGFSLAAGLGVAWGVRAASRVVAAIGSISYERLTVALALMFVVSYGGAAAAYYEKWYSTVRKSELVPYERTAATLLALVPSGPKDLFGPPHFWPPFHAEPGVRFISYSLGSRFVRAGAPTFLLVDESQWLPDLKVPTNASLRDDWVGFIEASCALDGMAPGTAYGTIALYRCGGAPTSSAPRIVGDGIWYDVGEQIASLGPDELISQWTRHADPRRQPSDDPQVTLTENGVRIAGTGWPGLVDQFHASPGEAYLVRVVSTGARDGDLLYFGTWKEPQVLSLAGAASAGMATPLLHPPWFPGDRAFIAQGARVQIAIYSEAPRTDFVVSRVEIFRLRRAALQSGTN